MQGLVQFLFLSFVIFLTSPSFAQEGQDDESESKPEAESNVAPEIERVHDDDGLVLMGEVAYLSLDADDYLLHIRGIVGYTFDFGLQLGAHLTSCYLKRPSVDGQTRIDEDQRTIILEDDFLFWGFGPMAGFDIELKEDWVGLELTVMPNFPITNDSSGWSIEAGAYGYFSFEGATDGDFDLALMGGIKFGHFDVDGDHYPIESNQMMPGGGIIGQF